MSTFRFQFPTSVLSLGTAGISETHEHSHFNDPLNNFFMPVYHFTWVGPESHRRQLRLSLVYWLLISAPF